MEDERRFVTYPTYSESEGVVPKPVPLPDENLKRVDQEVTAERAEMRKRFESTAKAEKLHPQFLLFSGRVKSALAREAQGAVMVVIGKRGKKRRGPMIMAPAGRWLRRLAAPRGNRMRAAPHHVSVTHIGIRPCRYV